MSTRRLAAPRPPVGSFLPLRLLGSQLLQRLSPSFKFLLLMFSLLTLLLGCLSNLPVQCQ